MRPADDAPPAVGQPERLIAEARALGVPLERGQALLLLRLLDELTAWNRAYNLTAITEQIAMMRAHLLDSLAAGADLIGERVADVGTGAGFPGLPLAVLCPQRSFTLIDSVAKKIRFVTHAVGTLALSNVVPLQARVETLGHERPFDTIVTRAFAPLPRMLARVRPIAGPATRVVALKGRYPREELAQLPSDWRLMGVRAVSIAGLGAERHIVRLTLAT